MNNVELKEARQKLGLSQQAFATAIGMSLRMVKYMEAGGRAIHPRTERIVNSITGAIK